MLENDRRPIAGLLWGVPDQGRFMLDGVHFSWWANDLEEFVVTVSSLVGRMALQIQRGACAETAAHQLARQLLFDAKEP